MQDTARLGHPGGVLTPHDDLPLHQTPEPLARVATAAADHYDRYFFNGHTADGSLFFAAAMGHYPNRDVADAAFCVVHEGLQHSVFASGRCPRDRATRVGPIRVEVLEGLRTLRVTVEPNETGVVADVTFRARTPAVEEPRQTVVRDDRLVMDYTRLTQWGTWEGVVGHGARRHDVDPRHVRGVRDRSWGIRPVGDPTPTNAPPSIPQVFWLWAPLHFDEVCTHLATFEHADGRPWLASGAVVPVLDHPGAPTWGLDEPAREMATIRRELTWRPGTREMATAALELVEFGGDTHRIELERHLSFRMRGVGYLHPTFRHGSAHGELTVGAETLDLADLDPRDPANIHIQTVVTARWGDRVGTGVLEQLVIGPHEPTGLTGIVDGHPGP